MKVLKCALNEKKINRIRIFQTCPHTSIFWEYLFEASHSFLTYTSIRSNVLFQKTEKILIPHQRAADGRSGKNQSSVSFIHSLSLSYKLEHYC